MLLLAASHTNVAKGVFEFQLTCPGRATMTVSRVYYGLTTLLWPEHQFQIAAGKTFSRLDNGDRVSVTLFRNGDQMMVDDRTGETFFSYAGSNKVIPCQRSANRAIQIVTLPSWHPASDRHS
ncbi:hypothetical protein BTJ39_05780 [Izhakiella australiensis]|uniref:C-type lysozyme inhibitor domain-containing protein n=1 Tax=Izhakiella australiensis TaxID=1926881 RepID=A0A1S8YQS3_9GAMM|nr:hypothetical protein BTJ39_05780 [Izhakiella australiensis]